MSSAHQHLNTSAWQAAEAAFAEPACRAPAPSPARVIVRRSRRPAAPSAPADTPTAPAMDKGPRVFRVAAVASLSVGASVAETPAAATGPARLRRRAPEQRPGPVLHVVHALPERAPAPTLERLRADLTAVGPVLAAIAHAQSLRFIDDRSAADWLRLSRRVDVLRQEMKA